MNRYFDKRSEGDFTETQKIIATAGHAELAKQAYVLCVKKYEVKDGRSFFTALRGLLRLLGQAGHTQKTEGWHVPGGKFLPFDKMTHQQLFATWASVQQTVAKWVWNILPANADLHCQLLEQGLVFKANDVCAVMELVFELLQMHKGHFGIDLELGLYHLEGKVMTCLAQ
ncbi:MAG: hypothetical protein HGA71_19780 [Azonexaceae bacterium]|nr:hypothetical protein [Azonexaceae bacterium]